MTDDNADRSAQGLVTSAPHPMLRQLAVLEGDWLLEGSDLDGANASDGTLTRRWLPGGHFLVQEMAIDGHGDGAVEYIGYDRASEGLRSTLFGNEGPGPFCSFALEYFWRFDGERLTIWHGSIGSPARFTGTMNADCTTLDGCWEWPGGGYRALSRRASGTGLLGRA